MASTTAPSAATFRAVNRGGGLYSEAVSQRLGAVFAVAAHRLRLSPNAVTLLGLLVGLASSTALILLTPAATESRAVALVLGLAVGLGWQVAYALDCADGQLARVTGRTSTTGARLDILCDVATQIGVVTAIVAVAHAHAPDTPAWLGAAFAGTWMVNLVTSVLAGGQAAASLVASTRPAVQVVKLLRDYGAVVAACAIVVAAAPRWTGSLLAGFTLLNGVFLLASIAQSARPASRS